MMKQKGIEDYMNIIMQFISNELTAVEFESSYLSMFKEEERWMGEEAFQILDYLFCSADAFVADLPNVDQDHQDHIDEATFRKIAEVAYQKLKAIHQS